MPIKDQDSLDRTGTSRGELNSARRRVIKSPPGFPDELTETDARGSKAVKVFIQDQASVILDCYMTQQLASVTLALDTIADTQTITLTGGHGTTAGEFINLGEGANFSQFEVISVATDVLTLDSLMDIVYTTSATVERASPDMNVDGSSTPVIFRIAPITGQEIDVTRCIFNIEDTAQMDFETFGSGAALTNGCFLRLHNGTINNIFNWKTNGQFINRSFDHDFLTNIGNSNRGFTARTTFAGASKRGVTIRLVGADGDEFQVIVQDNLTAQDEIRMVAQGHAVVN